MDNATLRKNRKWGKFYLPESLQSTVDPAREAFDEAKTLLSSCLTKDKRKRQFLHAVNSIEDVVSLVNQTKDDYSKRRAKGKARQWLSALSSRLMFYAPVMDTIAQHHPEYVSLVWGAVKFLFVACLNHEEIISTLAKALSRIAQSLPRQALIVKLYPTFHIKQEMAVLYAHITRVLIRALQWYQEGPFRHALHSVTRPVAIRYKDLLEKIEDSSRQVDLWAMAAGQAELRDIHTGQSSVVSGILDLQGLSLKHEERLAEITNLLLPIAPQLAEIVNTQALHSSTFLDTNQRVFDLQIAQMLKYAAKGVTIDPELALRFSLFMRDRRHLKTQNPEVFWFSPKLRTWNDEKRSSVVHVKGSFATRFKAKDFSVAVAEALRSASANVLWVLPERHSGHEPQVHAIDLIKSLVLQAMRISKDFQTSKACVLTCARVQGATSESDWLDILFTILSGLSKVYIVFDVESLRHDDLTTDKEFSWPLAFMSFFSKLVSRGSNTVVKVLFISYGHARYTKLPNELRPQDITVTISPPRVVPKQRPSRGEQLALRRKGPGNRPLWEMSFLHRKS